MEGADWWRYVDVNRQVVWRDCCVAPETNPLSLPLIAGAVQSGGPFHVSCWEFPPRRVQLRVVVIDQCQPGAKAGRGLGVVRWEGSWCRVGFRVPPMELRLFGQVVPICVGRLVSIVVCRWGTPAGLGGTRAAWRSGDASDGCKLANRMGRWVQWQPGGCLADKLHMLEALLPL